MADTDIAVSIVQKIKPLSDLVKKDRSADGSSDTSDLPQNRENDSQQQIEESPAAVYCQPCDPISFAINVEPNSEFDANVSHLLNLGYTSDIQAISNILHSCGGNIADAEAILRVQYLDSFQSPSDCAQSSDFGAWRSDSPDGSLPDLVAPEMTQGGWDTGESGPASTFQTYIIEDHPITSDYLNYEYWEEHECEQFLRTELWKIADVKLNWLDPLWTLHQVFSFLIVPKGGFIPEWYHAPSCIAETRGKQDWDTLWKYPLKQFTVIDMPQTERIDCPIELRGSFEGPPNTAYAGGRFKMKVRLPLSFPMKPPRIYFDTPIYHPLYDHDGEFLIDPSKWSQKYSIRDVIEYVSSLLYLEKLDFVKLHMGGNADIANTWKSNQEQFSIVAATWTQRFAMQ